MSVLTKYIDKNLVMKSYGYDYEGIKEPSLDQLMILLGLSAV
jgi:hypothetical protein